MSERDDRDYVVKWYVALFVLLGIVSGSFAWFYGEINNFPIVKALGQSVVTASAVYFFVDRIVFTLQLRRIVDALYSVLRDPRFISERTNSQERRGILETLIRHDVANDELARFVMAELEKQTAGLENARFDEHWFVSVDALDERDITWKFRISYRSRVNKTKIQFIAYFDSEELNFHSIRAPNGRVVFSWMMASEFRKDTQWKNLFSIDEFRVAGQQIQVKTKRDESEKCLVYEAQIPFNAEREDWEIVVKVKQSRRFGAVSIPIQEMVKGFRVTADLRKLPTSGLLPFLPDSGSKPFKRTSPDGMDHEVLEVGSAGWFTPGSDIVLTWMEDVAVTS